MALVSLKEENLDKRVLEYRGADRTTAMQGGSGVVASFVRVMTATMPWSVGWILRGGRPSGRHD